MEIGPQNIVDAVAARNLLILENRTEDASRNGNVQSVIYPYEKSVLQIITPSKET